MDKECTGRRSMKTLVLRECFTGCRHIGPKSPRVWTVRKQMVVVIRPTSDGRDRIGCGDQPVSTRLLASDSNENCKTKLRLPLTAFGQTYEITAELLYRLLLRSRSQNLTYGPGNRRESICPKNTSSADRLTSAWRSTRNFSRLPSKNSVTVLGLRLGYPARRPPLRRGRCVPQTRRYQRGKQAKAAR